MIGLVLATHGPLAEAFVSSGKLIVGNIWDCFTETALNSLNRRYTRQSNRRMKGTV